MKKRKSPTVVNPQDKEYPIKPKHLDTTKRPQGFENILDYSQITLIWCVMDLCKHRNSWDSFTTDDFQEYISNAGRDRISSVAHFFEPRLSALLDRSFVDKEDYDWKKGYIYRPSHFLISTYFMWNPVKIPK